jgi:Zn/Cd-binding protein ZinT
LNLLARNLKIQLFTTMSIVMIQLKLKNSLARTYFHLPWAIGSLLNSHTGERGVRIIFEIKRQDQNSW